MYNDNESPKDTLFKAKHTDKYFNKVQHKEEYVLGIQTVFGKLGAAIVTNKGKVIACETKKMFTHRNTSGSVSKDVINEFFENNLHDAIEQTLKSAGLEYSKLKAISVTIGPGESFTIRHGLKYAQKLGIDHNIPVYAVNNQEAHIFDNRRNIIESGQNMKFPFFNVSVHKFTI
jgi:tRNA A37 threonylcarbamoyltransferase TsaD